MPARTASALFHGSSRGCSTGVATMSTAVSLWYSWSIISLSATNFANVRPPSVEGAKPIGTAARGVVMRTHLHFFLTQATPFSPLRPPTPTPQIAATAMQCLLFTCNCMQPLHLHDLHSAGHEQYALCVCRQFEVPCFQAIPRAWGVVGGGVVPPIEHRLDIMYIVRSSARCCIPGSCIALALHCSMLSFRCVATCSTWNNREGSGREGDTRQAYGQGSAGAGVQLMQLHGCFRAFLLCFGQFRAAKGGESTGNAGNLYSERHALRARSLWNASEGAGLWLMDQATGVPLHCLEGLDRQGRRIG